MKLALRSIANAGNIDKERITLSVVKECDVGDYLLARTGYNGEEVTIDIKNAYWFPFKAVVPGDIIVVYTKRGSDRDGSLKSGKTAHFYYWGLDSSIWSSDDSAAVLMYAPQYQQSSIEKLKR